MTTNNFKKTEKTFLLVAAISSLTITLPYVYAGDYGYQATNPDGGEVTKSKGDFWTYLGGLSTANKHVDRIVYLFDASSFSPGVGYYDSTDGSGTESYKWLRYWDEGGVNNNFHFLASTGPTAEGWHSIEIFAVDSNTYGFKVDGSSLPNITCSPTPCPNPTLTGVASWGTSTSTSDFVRANFKNLQLDDAGDSDIGYHGWQAESTDYKCNNSPSSVTFNLVVNNNIDQVQIDVGGGDECAINAGVWLYNNGLGG